MYVINILYREWIFKYTCQRIATTLNCLSGLKANRVERLLKPCVIRKKDLASHQSRDRKLSREGVHQVLIQVLRSNKCTFTVAWRHVFCEESIPEVEIPQSSVAKGMCISFLAGKLITSVKAVSGFLRQALGKLGFSHLPCLFPGSSNRPHTLAPIYLMKRMC